MSSPEQPEQTVRLSKSVVAMLALLFVIAIGVALGPTLMQGLEERRLLKTGSEAEATVIVVKDTGDRDNENPVVQLTVEIEAAGHKPWRAEIVTPLSAVELQKYPTGARVRVRYDPDDPRKVALVGPATQ